MIPTDEITIKIPGSTGNVGPGFDCIGLAVNIFNKISIKKSDKNFEIENNGVSKEKYDEIPYEQNLIVKGIKLSYPEIDLEKYKIIKSKQEEKLTCDGLFIEIGADPRLELPKQLNLLIDPETNEVSVNKLMETSLKGIFAAGDLTNASGPLKQTVTAAGQGAIAALSAYTYLSS